MSSLSGEGDGTGERNPRRSQRAVAAIFVHAGAGYHSMVNEKVHLEACSDAARAAMKFLKAGASATEAVEVAIKCLEDKEITNAGFGSNLNMDGVVECDATIVDHFGRSGACGAVPGIKNPIALAKLILDTSSKPLSLRRVPPNILVGEGARQFAEEHGMPSTLNEYLVSKNAKDRYIRWTKDLRKAESRLSLSVSPNARHIESPDSEHRSPTPGDYERAADPSTHLPHRDHTNAILTGIWNEGQPDSPGPAEFTSPVLTAAPTARSQKSPPSNPKAFDRSHMGFVTSAFQSRSASSKRPRVHKSLSEDSSNRGSHPKAFQAPPPSISPQSPTGHDGYGTTTKSDRQWLKMVEKEVNEKSYPIREEWLKQGGAKRPRPNDDDDVSDTIGAIAIDLNGNIAAGSSSGGIGIKHRGRIGPAALVGIGTAVIPEDPDDEEQASVAAVTSGTGEHMATTLASATCADRLLNWTRRGPGGRSVEEYDEQALMESFILDDFMGHPGVRNQPSTGAIGVMAAKKERNSIYFYFAHNTDSFALASMSSAEREPLCAMSRLGKVKPVAHGGRKIRLEH
ncbi:hypothetical protein OQA88_12377 [Cercophora sp. LCS_1]